ncbi:chorismate-binding protein [Sorangium sp. So ce375]|uniref:chorismate-binding protein n=1 Tax=Sorangium sp. So ce375 TaxID=3133306 RepID=UPI003F5BF019
MSSVVTRTLPADHVTPVRAYAALRAQSPGRSSFILESALPGERWGRYAILGYRARAESLLPSGFDPFATLADELAQAAAADTWNAPNAPSARDTARDLAARVCQAWVGFVAYDAVHQLVGVEPWADEAYLGRVMKDATVVVFDSVTQTMTIAGPSQGAVSRCAWELSHGPEQRSLPALDPEAVPEHLETPVADEDFAAKVAAAHKRVAAGEATQIVLARKFRAPLRGADPFDVYRALRVLAPSTHLYFLDFAESPFAPGLTIAGASGETLVRVERAPSAERRAGDASPIEVLRAGDASPIEVLRAGDASPIEVLRAAFASGSAVGAPTARASGVSRELEAGPRRIYGGAIGYFGPDGAEMAHTLGAIWVESGYFETMTGARIGNGSEPGAETERTRVDARAALSAIRAAQEARKASDAAEEKKAAAEKAAAERAASADTAQDA